MSTSKRSVRKSTYGIGALALIAMPGVVGTPYPAPMLANHAGTTLGMAEGIQIGAQRASETVIDGES